MIKILIADDHLLFRSLLEEMLEKDNDFKTIASCSNGFEVIKSCEKEQPDVAILDIGMPQKNGIETLQILKQQFPQTKVIMLTTFEDDINISSAVQLGADGYLIKDITPEALILSVKCIYNNMILFHSGAYKVLQSSIVALPNCKHQKITVNNMVFDNVDISILKLIVQGKSNKEIGSILNYSEGTIKNKISKLLSITGFSDRTELSVFAINQALV